MGAFSARGMSEAVDDGLIELRQALSWHLNTNCYPPVPLDLIDSCVLAIHAIEENEPDTLITFPEDILWRGRNQVPAWAVVDGLHVESFIDADEDWGF